MKVIKEDDMLAAVDRLIEKLAIYFEINDLTIERNKGEAMCMLESYLKLKSHKKVNEPLFSLAEV